MPVNCVAEVLVEALAAGLLVAGSVAGVAERAEVKQAHAVAAVEVVDLVSDALHVSQLCTRTSALILEVVSSV